MNPLHQLTIDTLLSKPSPLVLRTLEMGALAKLLNEESTRDGSEPNKPLPVNK